MSNNFIEKELEEIIRLLRVISHKIELENQLSEPKRILSRFDERFEKSLMLIQNSFDRIHDKLFSFNNILIGVYMILGTFPRDFPILSIWTVIFPIMNLFFLIYLEYSQMKIHRYTSYENNWKKNDQDNYTIMIRKQTLLSLFSILTTFLCFLHMMYNILFL